MGHAAENSREQPGSDADANREKNETRFAGSKETPRDRNEPGGTQQAVIHGKSGYASWRQPQRK